MYLSRLVCSANTFSFFLGVLLPLSTGSNSAFSQSEQQPLFNGQNLAGWDTWLGAPHVPTFPVLFWGDWPAQVGLNNDPRDVYQDQRLILV